MIKLIPIKQKKKFIISHKFTWILNFLVENEHASFLPGKSFHVDIPSQETVELIMISLSKLKY